MLVISLISDVDTAYSAFVVITITVTIITPPSSSPTYALRVARSSGVGWQVRGREGIGLRVGWKKGDGVKRQGQGVKGTRGKEVK
jgi:hypothetical protein